MKRKKNIKITVLDGTKNIGANNNFIETFKTSVGQWLAICEGDDYWCDQGNYKNSTTTLFHIVIAH